MSKENLKNKNHTSHFALHTSKQKGITLIALIITIIVMLILTGVTLSITLGDNGLVNKAKEATEATEVAMDRELLLSAVVGTIGNDGEVNLSAIVLPEGFIGSNGTYTSKNGNTFTVSENGEIVYTGSNGGTGDNIIENGGEVTTVNLDGTYYDLYGGTIEIKDNKIDFPDDYEIPDGEITINKETNSGIITIIYNYEDEETYVEENPFIYEKILENDSIVNIVFYWYWSSGEDESDTQFMMSKNTNGFEYDLEGDYISDDGRGKLTFKNYAPDDLEEGRNVYRYNASGESWVINTSSEKRYFSVNDRYYIDSEEVTVSNDKNTVILKGRTYTKQIAN